MSNAYQKSASDKDRWPVIFLRADHENGVKLVCSISAHDEGGAIVMGKIRLDNHFSEIRAGIVSLDARGIPETYRHRIKENAAIDQFIDFDLLKNRKIKEIDLKDETYYLKLQKDPYEPWLDSLPDLSSI